LTEVVVADAVGFTFYKFREAGNIRKKAVVRPISTTGDIADRKLLIKAAEIDKIVATGD